MCGAAENIFNQNHNNNFININQNESSLIAVKSTIYDDLDDNIVVDDDDIVIDAAAAVASPTSNLNAVADVAESNNKRNDNPDDLMRSRGSGSGSSPARLNNRRRSSAGIRSNNAKMNSEIIINSLTDDDRLILR